MSQQQEREAMFEAMRQYAGSIGTSTEDQPGEVDQLFMDAISLWLDNPSFQGLSSDGQKAVEAVETYGLGFAFALVYVDSILTRMDMPGGLYGGQK